MNWTGGNLQRFSNKGKGNALTRKQKDYFARQRLRLQDARPAQSPLKFGTFDFGDTIINLARQLPNPQQQGQARSDVQGKHEPGQARLEGFDSSAGIVYRLANMSRRPAENVRKRKRSRDYSQEYAETSTHQSAYDHRFPLPQNPPREHHSRSPPSTHVLKTPFDIHSTRRNASLESSHSSKPKFSFLKTDDWVGIAHSKPIQINFPTAKERDRIGKRRKMTKDDLARKQAPARPRYEPSLDDRNRGWRHDGCNSLLDDISIRIGKPGQTSHGSVIPTQTSTQTSGTQLSSDSMLLDNENMNFENFTPTQMGARFIGTTLHHPRPINAMRHQVLTTSPQDSASNKLITPPLPRLRKQFDLYNPTASKFRPNQQEQNGSGYAPLLTKHWQKVAAPPLFSSKSFASTSPNVESDGRPRIYGQIPIYAPEEYTSTWKGLSTSSSPVQDIFDNKPRLQPAIRSSGARNGSLTHEEARVDLDTHTQYSSRESQSEFEALCADSEALYSEAQEEAQSEGTNRQWQLQGTETGNGSITRRTPSDAESYDSFPHHTVKDASPVHESINVVEAAEDDPWMKFIFGNGLDQTVDGAEGKTNLLKKQPEIESASVGQPGSRFNLGFNILDYPGPGKHGARLIRKIASDDSSLLTEPNHGQSTDRIRESRDQSPGARDFTCSNESFRGSGIPSHRRPLSRQGFPSVHPIDTIDEVVSRSMEHDSNYPQVGDNDRYLQEELIMKGGSLSVDVDINSRHEEDAFGSSYRTIPPA